MLKFRLTRADLSRYLLVRISTKFRSTVNFGDSSSNPCAVNSLPSPLARTDRLAWTAELLSQMVRDAAMVGARPVSIGMFAEAIGAISAYSGCVWWRSVDL